MATTTQPTTVETLGPQIIVPSTKRAALPQPLGWASIFAAAVIAIGLTLLLHLLGIGIGLTAIQPDDPSSLRAAGIGTGVWSVIVPIIALFIAGLVVGRVGPTLDSWNAAIHGAATWALTTILAVIMVGMTLGAVARGAASTAKTVASASSGTLGYAAENAGGLPMLGIDSKDLVARINQQLRERGMPEVKAENVEAAIREGVQVAVREGGIDRERAVAIAAKHTALSREQAEQVADDMERQFNELKAKGATTGRQAGQMALSAAEGTGKVVLALSIAMLLALCAAVIGALISVRRQRREVVVRPAETR